MRDMSSILFHFPATKDTYCILSQLFVFNFCLLSQLFTPVLKLGFELRASVYKYLARRIPFASHRPCDLTNHISSLELGLTDLLG